MRVSLPAKLVLLLLPNSGSFETSSLTVTRAHARTVTLTQKTWIEQFKITQHKNEFLCRPTVKCSTKGVSNKLFLCQKSEAQDHTTERRFRGQHPCIVCGRERDQPQRPMFFVVFIQSLSTSNYTVASTFHIPQFITLPSDISEGLRASLNKLVRCTLAVDASHW
jgi:hypothetical protein